MSEWTKADLDALEVGFCSRCDAGSALLDGREDDCEFCDGQAIPFRAAADRIRELEKLCGEAAGELREVAELVEQSELTDAEIVEQTRPIAARLESATHPTPGAKP